MKNKQQIKMQRIKNVDEIRVLLESRDYKEIEVNEFVNMIKPFYDFYDYMLETHNMTYEQVEEDSSKFSEEVFNDYLEEMSKSESPMKFMVEISGDIFKRYADKYDYSEPDKVKIALNKYMEIVLKDHLK